MSMIPTKEGETVIHRTDLEPADPKDSRNRWQKLVSAIRIAMGMKPLYLAERWSVAKIRHEEASADAKMLSAKAEYEIGMAQARAIELEAQGRLAKNLAIATLLESQANPIVLELLKNKTTTEAISELKSIVEQIRKFGGDVEIEFPNLTQAKLDIDRRK